MLRHFAPLLAANAVPLRWFFVQAGGRCHAWRSDCSGDLRRELYCCSGWDRTQLHLTAYSGKPHTLCARTPQSVVPREPCCTRLLLGDCRGHNSACFVCALTAIGALQVGTLLNIGRQVQAWGRMPEMDRVLVELAPPQTTIR